MCGNDGLQQVSGLFFPGMDTIPLRSLHAKGGVGRSSEKDRFLYTSFLIALRKRTRSDIYVVRIPFRSVLSMLKAGSGEHKKQPTISIPMSEFSQASVRQLF